MRLQGSRLNQLVLVLLTIGCALGVGYIIGSILSGGPYPSAAVELPEIDLTTVAVTETEAPSEVAVASVVTTTLPTTMPSPSASAEAALATQVVPTPAPQPEVFINEDFSAQTATFQSRETPTWSAAYVNGRYQLKLNGQTNIGLVGDLPADNYRLSVDVVVDQGGAGVVFLAGEPQVSYRIIITQDGAYSIERQEANTATKIQDWTESPSLLPDPGAINRLRIERVGAVIEFFANDQPLTRFDVPPGEFVNRYGFVLTSRSGQGQASFDNLLGERLPNS